MSIHSHCQCLAPPNEVGGAGRRDLGPITLDVQNCTRGPLQVLYFRLWPVSTVAQQPETQLSTWIKYGFDYYINLRSEREMRVGSGNFVTCRINFVINRILLESILSPTVSGISLVILMVLSLSVFLTMSFKTIQFVIFDVIN